MRSFFLFINCQSTGNCPVILNTLQVSIISSLSFLQVIYFIYENLCLLTLISEVLYPSLSVSKYHVTCAFKNYVIYSIIQDISKCSAFQVRNHKTLFVLFLCSVRISLTSLKSIFCLHMCAVGSLYYDFLV